MQALQTIRANAMIKQTQADATPEQIMIAIGQSGVHPEGRFFPDTHRFPKDTSDLTLLKQAYATMSKALSDEWAQRAPDLPYTPPAQAFTMAPERKTVAQGK